MEIPFQGNVLIPDFAMQLNLIVAKFVNDHLEVWTTRNDVDVNKMYEKTYIELFAKIIQLFSQGNIEIKNTYSWWPVFRNEMGKTEYDVIMRRSGHTQLMEEPLISDFFRQCAGLFRNYPRNEVSSAFGKIRCKFSTWNVPNEKHFGFQVKLYTDALLKATEQLQPLQKQLLEVVNRIFTSAFYDFTENADRHSLNRVRTSKVFVDFVSSFAATLLDYFKLYYIDRDGSVVEQLQDAVEELVEKYLIENYKLTANGAIIFVKKTYLGFKKMESIIIGEKQFISIRGNKMSGTSLYTENKEIVSERKLPVTARTVRSG